MNKEAIEYYQSVSSRMEDFCKPLVEYLGITVFGYFKVYRDGSYIFISNRDQLTKEYISMVNSDFIYFQNYLENKNSNKLILWPSAPNTQGMQIFFNQGYWHGFNIVQQREDSNESFFFVSGNNNSQINQFYIKHANILENFTEHFKTIFVNEIAKCELYKAKYKNGFNFYLPESIMEKEPFDIQAFLEAAGIDQGLIRVNGQSVRLTQRERQCLELMHKGHSLKGIGRELLISPRTIESHINNIKQKTGYHYKYDLIQLYSNSL